MKKIIITLIVFFAISANANAQTAVFSATTHQRAGVVQVTITWEADGAGAVSEAFNVDIPGLPDLLSGMGCYRAVAIPGTGTAPADLYDITVTTSYLLDVFKGRLIDRSATVPQDATPKIGAATDFVSGWFPVDFNSSLTGDVWIFTVANAGAGGQGVLKLWFR